jgi:hypothetical protein
VKKRSNVPRPSLFIHDDFYTAALSFDRTPQMW